MVVSHDRYFMDKIVDHLFIFRGNSVVEDFPGNYSDFRTYEDSKPSESKALSNDNKGNWKTQEKKSKLSFNEQKEHAKLEREVAKLEREKETLESKFATEDWNPEEIQKQSVILQELIQNLEKKTERWFLLSDKMEG